MHYLIFFLYLSIGAFLIRRVPFVKNSGIPSGMIIPLFLLKIIAGLAIGWLSDKYYPQGNDYHILNDEGFKEYQLLLSDPKEFFSNIFVSTYSHYDGFFDSIGSYWNDLKNNLIIKAIAICNIFSRGDYYTNSLFFNFFSFIGHVALFRVFLHMFPLKKWAAITGCFLVPTMLYFTSGIYKDLVVFSMLGFFCYALYFSVEHNASVRRIAVLIISWLCILLIRNYVAVILLPLGTAFFISSRYKKNSLAVNGITYAVCLMLLIILPLIRPGLQPLKIIAQKQQDFSALPVASSQIGNTNLEPNLKSFVKELPVAVNHGFFRPYVWEKGGRFNLPLAIELMALQALIVLSIITYNRSLAINRPFIIFGFALAITLILLTGYIVPNTGSIARYRSVYLPFIVTPLLAMINSRKKNYTLHINL